MEISSQAGRRGKFAEAIRETTLLHFLVLLAGVVAIVLFGLLARAVMAQDFAAVNRALLLDVHGFEAPWLDGVAIAFTTLGSPVAIAVIGILMGALLLKAGRRIDTWTLAAVLIGGAILSTALKLVFHQARPTVFTPIVHAAGMSFPSGHALISFCLWGAVAVWLVTHEERAWWYWPVAILALLLAALVALSRLYLGVHWPTDVIAGMLVAIFWVSACFNARWYLRRKVAQPTEEGGSAATHGEAP